MSYSPSPANRLHYCTSQVGAHQELPKLSLGAFGQRANHVSSPVNKVIREDPLSRHFPMATFSNAASFGFSVPIKKKKERKKPLKRFCSDQRHHR